MDVSRFCQTARVLIVAGKGGVGKTTVTAAMASMAASAGHTCLIIEVEGKSGIGEVFGRPGPLGYDAVELRPGIAARTLTPDDALLEYLEDKGMRRISKRLANSGALDVVATAVPGIKDILILGKVKQLERESPVDLIVLDAPAAGHTVTFLTSAAGLLDAAQAGPVRAQAEEVVALLSDPRRCQVVLVTLPEETPVNEVVETAYALEDKVGIKLGPVVVNGLWSPIDGLTVEPPLPPADLSVDDPLTAAQREALGAAAAFRATRQALQADQRARLAHALPLHQLPLPFLFTPEVAAAELRVLSDALAEAIGALP